jgi:hypothetical protein
LSSANCWAGILKNEKPIAACVSFYFLMLCLLFFFLFFFLLFFFPMILNGGDTLMVSQEIWEKKFGWSFEVLKEIGVFVYG